MTPTKPINRKLNSFLLSCCDHFKAIDYNKASFDVLQNCPLQQWRYVKCLSKTQDFRDGCLKLFFCAYVGSQGAGVEQTLKPQYDVDFTDIEELVHSVWQNTDQKKSIDTKHQRHVKHVQNVEKTVNRVQLTCIYKIM